MLIRTSSIYQKINRHRSGGHPAFGKIVLAFTGLCAYVITYLVLKLLIKIICITIA